MATQNRGRTITDVDVSALYRNVLGIPLRKKIITGVGVVFLLFIAFVCAYLLLRNKPNKVELNNIYSNIFSVDYLNTSVDPCSNFYEFTCGSWVHNQSISAFSTLQETVNEKVKDIFKNSVPSSDYPRIVNDAFRFYNFCITLDRNTSSDLNYIMNSFDKMGGWPILQSSIWDESKFDWIITSVHLLIHMDLELLFGIHISVDDYKASSNMIYITVPHIEKDVFSLEEFHTRHMLQIILYTLNPAADDELIIKDVNGLQKIETAWKGIIESVNKTDPLRITLNNLLKEIPEIDFESYINFYLMNNFGDLSFKVSKDDTVLIENLDYLKMAASILLSETYSRRDLANLFGWFFVQNSLILIPDVMKNYAEANGFDLQEMMETIEDKCYEKTLEIYECGFDYLYIQNVSHNGVADSKILVQYLKNSLTDSFSMSSSLDDSTRNAAIRKLNSLQSVVGFQSNYAQKQQFDNIYKDLPGVSENILKTFYKIKNYFLLEVVNQLKDGNVLDYYIPRSVTHVSAYYILQQNMLVVPISLFSSPFYYESAPWYINFGALGVIIGHEMIHAFDKRGCLRDEHGRLNDWWTKESLDNYNISSACFKKQFISYFRNDGLSPTASTLNENMADSEGLHIAYKAYKQFVKDNVPGSSYPHLEFYSPDQMFFISYGTVWCSKQGAKRTSDVHSSPEFRVNSAVSNSEYFARAFQCSDRANMNPYDKCRLW